MKIAILGSGGWGLALACTLSRLGHEVTVWSAFKDELDSIRRTGELRAKLPGVQIPRTVKLTEDICCCENKDIIVVGIPTKFVRDVCNQAREHISPSSIIVSCSKGLEEGSLKRMSEVIGEVFPENTVVVLTGPSHAEELGRGIPTAVVVASSDRDAAMLIQRTFSDNVLRLYVNSDVIGCEIGGAIKNVIALCCGVLEGLGLGDNSRAALITRGLSEITRLGVAMGGTADTFCGLAGIGDLIVTCTSMHSRNFRAGILIGQGTDPEEAVRIVGTVEGYGCAAATLELSRRYGVDMPITREINGILFLGRSPKDAISALMGRPYRSE
ncbi:MAG TPA: NAD(P)-dependent glycerol-3-phosphate dehydrogenase [Candidatus Faeciplasma avium]|uniref:Glycerol-3-phosphate dehydrogenase [NAD(P)+] n=1 Tax=Candidatus Faeciplasma avium TaxID=2840798 RepID=A0A9D1NSH6_9FIRM|nr:NAD(P)-dependent glycerol-3-phosphate dehydrogenase [Candidatus Faeciplasma avium]